MMLWFFSREGRRRYATREKEGIRDRIFFHSPVPSFADER
jgi:hypothetical protein